MKRLISIILMVSIVMTSMSSIALAKEKKDTGKEMPSTEEQINAYADELGIELMPFDITEDDSFEEIALPNDDVDKINKNDKNNDNNIDATIQILGGSSASGAQRINVNTTTSDSIGTAGAVDWFVFKTSTGAGAYNIYSTGSTDTYGEIYKKNILGQYVLVDGDDDDGSGLNFYLPVGLNSNTDYYIKVRHYSSYQTGSYSLRVEENKDKTTSSAGGSWTWDVALPDPDGSNYNVDKITYLSSEKAQAYYIAITRDDFHEIRDHALSLSYNAGVAYLMSALGIVKAVATFIIGESVSFLIPSLTDLELDNIYNATNNFQYGLKITSITSRTISGISVRMNLFEKWSGSTIYGGPRYRGSFDTSDFEPMWR